MEKERGGWGRGAWGLCERRDGERESKAAPGKGASTT